MSFSNKISAIIKNEGALGILNRLIRKFIYRKQTILVVKRDLNRPQKRFKTSKRWEVRQITKQDLGICKTHFGAYINDYKDLFAEDFVAFGAIEVETGNLIAIAWYAPRDFYDQHYHRYTFKVTPDQVFQFAGEVSEQYRNTPVSVNVMYPAWNYWKEQGKQEVRCTIDATNAASMRLVFHLDWEEAGELIHFHRLFGMEWQTVEYYEGERFQAYKKKRKPQTSEND